VKLWADAAAHRVRLVNANQEVVMSGNRMGCSWWDFDGTAELCAGDRQVSIKEM